MQSTCTWFAFYSRLSGGSKVPSKQDKVNEVISKLFKLVIFSSSIRAKDDVDIRRQTNASVFRHAIDKRTSGHNWWIIVLSLRQCWLFCHFIALNLRRR